MLLSDLDRYDYKLPPELIRKQGVEPRDSARLFVYDTRTDEVRFDVFRNIGKYLPARPLLAMNETRVVPARLWLRKETGGKIEAFVLVNQMESEERIPLLVDRKILPGQKLLFPNGDFLEILSQEESVFYACVRSAGGTSIFTLLDEFGETPLPHYLEGGEMTERELRERYQSVFAAGGSSVAAPTASLHFTEGLLAALTERGAESVTLSLEVGLGTFAPLREENFQTRRLHPERVRLSEEAAAALRRSKEAERPIIAVGTTVIRTLETATRTDGKIRAFSGMTDIFIYPPHHFKAADGLVTNFHLPRTSLLLLVDAFLKDKGGARNIMDLYAIAIKEGFAFYSFGDSMLIL